MKVRQLFETMVDDLRNSLEYKNYEHLLQLLKTTENIINSTENIHYFDLVSRKLNRKDSLDEKIDRLDMESSGVFHQTPMFQEKQQLTLQLKELDPDYNAQAIYYQMKIIKDIVQQLQKDFTEVPKIDETSKRVNQYLLISQSLLVCRKIIASVEGNC